MAHVGRVAAWAVTVTGLLTSGVWASDSSARLPARAMSWENDSLCVRWRLGESSLEITNLGTKDRVTVPIGIESLGLGADRVGGLGGKPVKVEVGETDRGTVWAFAFSPVVSPRPPMTVNLAVTFELDRAGGWIRKRPVLTLSGFDQAVLLKDVVIDSLSLKGQSPRQPFDGWQSYPVLCTSFFCGVEFPVAHATVSQEVARLAYAPGVRLKAGARYEVWPTVYGVSKPGKSRAAFEAYIQSMRPASGPMHIQYNSWWSAPYPFTEKHMLDLIEAFRANFYKPHGARLDTFCLDMGWTNRQTIWQIDSKNFPQGFSNLDKALRQIESRLGLWCSPSSCYPDAQDLDWAEKNGYETFVEGPRFGCLGGARYEGAFRDSLADLTRRYEVSHIKFDGYRPFCPQSNHGHEPGELSAERVALGMIDMYKTIHGVNPNSWFEPTCFGFRPSPWWLMYVNTVIGTFGDDAPPGRVPCPIYRESYTTARDFFNLQGAKDVLIPINAQEVLGIIHQTSDALQNDSVVTILRGHSFIPLYVNPKFMDARRWRFLARLCNWARANAEVLNTTAIICQGDWNDEKASRLWEGTLPRDPYGYAHFKGDRGLVMLRNPWVQPRRTSVVLDEAIGCPPALKDAAAVVLYPAYGRLPGKVSYGSPIEMDLGPYETRLVAVGGAADAPVLQEDRPVLTTASVDLKIDPKGGMYTLGLDAQTDRGQGQLWILYESAAPTLEPVVKVKANGAAVKVQTTVSETGWRASGHKDNEYWRWCLADLPAGKSAVQAEIEALPGCRVSAWVVTNRAIADDADGKRPIPPPEVRYFNASCVLPLIGPPSAEAVVTRLDLARRGATANASSVWAEEHAAAKVIDGDVSTRWNAAKDDKVGSWLAVDLGKPRMVREVRFVEACGGRITEYAIQVWTGSQWRDVVTATKEANRTQPRHRFDPVQTTKVRLLVKAATEVPSLTEFGVYGSEAEPTTRP